MEKLFRRLIAFMCFTVLYVGTSAAQGNLCLIEVKGLPQIEVKDEYRNAKKGDVLDATHKVQLKENQSVKFIDQNGNLYAVSQQGTYGMSDVMNQKLQKEEVNVTKKYFAFLYKKMFTAHQNNSKAGVVYRLNPSGTLIFPKDQRQIVKDTIRFEWTNEVFQTLTFNLINRKTNKSFKVITNGNYITLPVDGTMLKTGDEYEWTILANGDLKPTYHKFTILDKGAAIPLSEKASTFKDKLLALGFDKAKIQSIIADSFNIQY